MLWIFLTAAAAPLQVAAEGVRFGGLRRHLRHGGPAVDVRPSVDETPAVGREAAEFPLHGAEGAGIRRLTEERCDYLISIPMQGQVSSLNVSVATGVCLYEALRQRGA